MGVQQDQHPAGTGQASKQRVVICSWCVALLLFAAFAAFATSQVRIAQGFEVHGAPDREVFPNAPDLDPTAVDSYRAGALSAAQRNQFETNVRYGFVRVPDGETIVVSRHVEGWEVPATLVGGFAAFLAVALALLRYALLGDTGLPMRGHRGGRQLSH